jgi:SAM-dependent methyltransferase
LGYRVVGLDAVRILLERLDGPNRDLVHADLCRGLPARMGQFDAVLLLDVIEHLENESPVLTGILEHLGPRGLLVVTVPARADLWSTFDLVQGHRRRYSPGLLRTVLEKAGYRVEPPLWWGGWMVPLLRSRRRVPLSDATAAAQYEQFLRLPPAGLRWFMEGAFRLDHHWTLRGLNWTGTSLVALARPAG